MSDCGCGAEEADKLEKRTLISLLLINGVMFFVEFFFGWFAQSTGLIADSLDMLADAMVYGLSLYAVGKGLKQKASATTVSGYLQILLGIGVLIEVLRRLIYGSEPQSTLIIIIGLVALIANILCLVLISKHKDAGVHMRASWIFSTNDVIANLGVICSGILVGAVGSRFPDLIIGCVIAVIVVRGGLKILRESKQSMTSKSH